MARKKSIKSTTVDYLVDLTSAQSAADVFLAFAEAKANANFTQNEFDALMNTLRPQIYIVYPEHVDLKVENTEPVKKPNIFKRAWNWLTGK